jgi:hypothetical protein
MMRFHDAKVFFLHSAVRAVVLPALMGFFAFWVSRVTDTFGDVFSPVMVQAGVYLCLGCAALGIVAFAPGMLRDVRDILMLAAQLKDHNIRPVWLKRPSFTVDGHTKRYFGHGVVAICLVVLGIFVGGWFGMLLRITGVAGVGYLGLMLAVTGDVVVGRGEDKDLDL